MSEIVIYQYECSNCTRVFPSVPEFEGHRDSCTKVYRNKPHYKKVVGPDRPATDRPSQNITGGKKDNIMPNRFHTKVRNAFYQFIADRDGEYCIHCKVQPTRDGPLEIDHADNNPTNWDPENLHLLCNKCNLDLRQLTTEEHIARIRVDSDHNVCVREKRLGSLGTGLTKKLVDYTQGSPEMKANNHYEKHFRDWILTVIDDTGVMTREEVINSGAEYCGCSPITIKRYLDKLTSSWGPLVATDSGLNQTVIMRRKADNAET